MIPKSVEENGNKQIDDFKDAIAQEGSESSFTALLNVLIEKGYRNHGKQWSYAGVLLQREYKAGCFFNFYLHAKDSVIPIDMASAEICFQCGDDGQWCKHQLYGVNVDVLAKKVDETEEKLFAIYVKYEGHRYI
jgi:hypothetical protein